MEAIFPTGDGYSGIFIRGLRSAGAAGAEDAGAAIVKRSFSVDGGGALTPDASGERIVTGDSIVAGADNVQVTQESDLIPRKHHGDVIVLGHHGGDTGGRIMIDAGAGFVTWLSRNAGIDNVNDPDIGDNLFGWHPRTAAIRLDDSRPATGAGLAGDHLDHFYNAHRRSSGGFSSSGFNHAGAATVEIFQVRSAGTASFAFGYDFAPLTARYFTYCGCGPDREAYWTPVSIGALTLDMLVIRPADSTISAVWRASWPWDAAPVEAYRRLVVEET